MAVRNYSNTAAQSTLSASIAPTDTTITLINYVGDPTPPFTAALARGTANEEIVLVTGAVGSTVTVTRAYDGTTAKAQAAGATFQEVVVALDFREANNHVNSGSSGAHGTTSQVVGVSDAQTLTNKTLTAPTISSPTITGTETVVTSNITTLNVSGVSTLTTLSVTGNATVAGTLGVTGATTLASTTISALTVTGASSLAAATLSGLLTANGGITVPAGKKATLTDAPAAATDAANKGYVDGKTWPSAAINDGTSLATPLRVAIRDVNGRTQFADPAATQDAATKNYVDTGAGGSGWTAITPSGNWTVGASGLCQYRVGRGSTTVSVYLANSGSWAAGELLFTLPSGAPKGSRLSVASVYGTSANQVLINTDGTVVILLAGSNGGVAFTATFPNT